MPRGFVYNSNFVMETATSIEAKARFGVYFCFNVFINVRFNDLMKTTHFSRACASDGTLDPLFLAYIFLEDRNLHAELILLYYLHLIISANMFSLRGRSGSC